MLIDTQYVETTFCIKGEGGIGTAFAIDVGGHTWFVTASHNIGGGTEGNAVYFKARDGWRRFNLGTVVKHSTMDVCMFQSDFSILGAPKIESDPTVLATYGQRVVFLGFPHGLSNTYVSDFGMQTPLCRNAFFSGLVLEADTSLIVLDGFNNPGYSGAPVWFGREGENALNLLGVISGYRVEERSKSAVYEDMEDGTEKKREDLFVKPNSGMIHVVPVEAIKSLIPISRVV